MAIKYNRSDSVHAAREARETPYRRQPTFCKGNPKRRLMLIYIGLIAAAVFLFFLDHFITKPRTPEATSQRGVAVVVEKVQLESAPPTYALRLQLEDMPDAPVQEVPFPEEYWEDIQEGDQLMAIYTVSKETGEISIKETGLVALSGGIR